MPTETVKLLLERFLSCEHGVFGNLTMPDEFVFMSGEDEWKDNQPRVSCIPTGTYALKRIVSPKFGDVFEITGVPGRDHILIHPGNTEEDTEGCVLLGMVLGWKLVDKDEESGKRNKKLSVLQSQTAFARFMAKMGTLKEAVLVVRWYGE